MATSMGAVSVALGFPESRAAGWIATVGIISYTAAFCLGCGPLPWIVRRYGFILVLPMRALYRLKSIKSRLLTDAKFSYIYTKFSYIYTKFSYIYTKFSYIVLYKI
eukprot:SAG11_NODE_3465_length_2431_cov_1.608919_3_plen_106_part_00